MPLSITLPPAPQHTLTLAELAEVLNIGRTQAYELARRDELPIPTLKIGRQFRFSRRALERWLDRERAALPDAS